VKVIFSLYLFSLYNKMIHRYFVTMQYFRKKEIRIMSTNRNNEDSKDVVQFFVGLVMTVVGGYLFMQNVEVYSASIFSFSLMGRHMDGLIFIPLIASIIFLFYKYGTASKICCGLSLLIIVVNVIMNLRLYWRASSLFVTILIFILLFGGIGILAKVLFANPSGRHGKNY